MLAQEVDRIVVAATASVLATAPATERLVAVTGGDLYLLVQAADAEDRARSLSATVSTHLMAYLG